MILVLVYHFRMKYQYQVKLVGFIQILPLFIKGYAHKVSTESHAETL